MRKMFHLAMVATAFSAASSAMAAIVTVDTSGGTTTDTVWTVADPDFGTYTVTVAGFATRSLSSSNHWYRNSSQAVENDAVITWTVSGLDAGAQIVAFSLGTTQITPSVGSGSTWQYVTTLSGNDVVTGTPVTVSRTYASTASPQAHDLTGAFGGAPTFSLAIDEQEPLSTRTLGTRNFTITAAAVPEPAAALAIGAIAAALLGRRRRTIA